MGGRNGEEDQPTVPYDELARAIREQQAAYLEIRDGDFNLTRAIKIRILGQSNSEAGATFKHVGGREVERGVGTVAGARNINP